MVDLSLHDITFLYGLAGILLGFSFYETIKRIF